MELVQCIDLIKQAMNYLPANMYADPKRVHVAMLSIGLQESLLEHRYQVLNDKTKKGPARGLWQFEKLGGVQGIMNHVATREPLKKAIAVLGVPFTATAIWEALEFNDVLAAVCARLLLYSDPKPLPAVYDTEAMWQYYLRNWRPGAYANGGPDARKALRDKFGKYHGQALKEVLK